MPKIDQGVVTFPARFILKWSLGNQRAFREALRWGSNDANQLNTSFPNFGSNFFLTEPFMKWWCRGLDLKYTFSSRPSNEHRDRSESENCEIFCRKLWRSTDHYYPLLTTSVLSMPNPLQCQMAVVGSFDLAISLFAILLILHLLVSDFLNANITNASYFLVLAGVLIISNLHKFDKYISIVSPNELFCLL